MRSTDEVKANIRKLVEAGAPESDIDEFVRLEGYTAESLRSAAPEQLTAQQRFPGAVTGGADSGSLPPELMEAMGGGVGLASAKAAGPVWSGAVEGAAMLPGTIENLGRAAIGTVAGLSGLGPDYMPEIVDHRKMLRDAGITKDYSKDSSGGRFVSRVMQDVGAGAQFGPIGAASGFASGTGAAIANELFPGSQTAETVGSLAGALTPSAARFSVDKLSPTRAVASSSQIKELAPTPYGKRGSVIERQNQVDLKLSQKYGSQKAAGMEAEAMAMKPLEASRDELARKAQFGRRLESVLGRVNPTGAGGKESAQRAYNAFEAENNMVLAGRKSNWNKTMDQANALTSGKRVISVEPALLKLQTEIDDLSSMTVRGQADDEALNILKQEHKKLSSSGGHLSIKELQSNLSSHTSDAYGTGKFYKDVSDAAERRVHGVMKSALDESLDSFATAPIKSPDNTYARAGQLVKQARADYGLQGEYLDELGARVLGKALGKKEELTTDAIQKAIRGSGPDERKYLMPIVEKYDPAAAQGLKEDHIRKILEKSKPSESTVGPTGGIDFKKLASNWKIDSEFMSTFTNKTERRDLIRVRQALRRLAEEPAPKHSQSVTSSMTEIAGVAGSLHPVFILRALARRATPSTMVKILYTKEGRNALEIAAGTKKAPSSETKTATDFMRKLVEENPGAIISNTMDSQ